MAKTVDCSPSAELLQLINFDYINKRVLPEIIGSIASNTTTGAVGFLAIFSPSWILNTLFMLIKDRKLFNYFEKLSFNMGRYFAYHQQEDYYNSFLEYARGKQSHELFFKRHNGKIQEFDIIHIKELVLITSLFLKLGILVVTMGWRLWKMRKSIPQNKLFSRRVKT